MLKLFYAVYLLLAYWAAGRRSNLFSMNARAQAVLYNFKDALLKVTAVKVFIIFIINGVMASVW